MEHNVFTIPLPPAKPPGRASPGANKCQGGGLDWPADVDTGQRSAWGFIAGPENRLAGGVVEWLLTPVGHGYSPVVLHGPSGAGKSHLAQGIAGMRGSDLGNQGVLCIQGADFARELADAVEGGTVPAWRERYRWADLLVLEDLGQLNGKRAAQQELLNTLDALEAREATVVITSRRPPAEMGRLSAGLRSRLIGGLVVSIAPPGLEARTVILQRLAVARGLDLEPAAAQMLAAAMAVTAGELHGALLELEMRMAEEQESLPSAARPVSIGVDRVRLFLQSRRALRCPQLDDVTKCVARHYSLKSADLMGASRRRSVVRARNVAIYLGRQLLGSSLQRLAKHFGGRDHTTVLHSLRSVERQLTADGELRAAVTSLRRKLETGCGSESRGGDNKSRKRR